MRSVHESPASTSKSMVNMSQKLWIFLAHCVFYDSNTFNLPFIDVPDSVQQDFWKD